VARFLAVLCVSAAALAGCASTGVIPFDQDSYFVGKKDGSPGLGVSLSNKAEVLKEANAFCTARSKEVKILRIESTPSAPGRLGSTEVVFRCVDPGGVAAPLSKDPDQIIELRQR
jgi:hypothetical protein